MNAEREMSFRTLGLDPGASWDDVKSAFRRLALACHPDVAGPASALRFQEITQAYMTLKQTLVVDAGGAASAPGRGGVRPPSSDPAEEMGVFARVFGGWWSWWRSRRVRREEARAESRRRAWEETEKRRRRQTLVDGLLDEAEQRFQDILQRAVVGGREGAVELHLERLSSGHPVVRCMALDALLERLAHPAVIPGIADALAAGNFSGESLRRLLGSRVPGHAAESFARAMTERMPLLEEGDALFALRWLRGLNGVGRDAVEASLFHPAPTVVGDALLQWPRSAPLPHDRALQHLLVREEDRVLVPLLRLLKGRPQSREVVELLRKKVSQHTSPAVRAWARALVSEAEAS